MKIIYLLQDNAVSHDLILLDQCDTELLHLWYTAKEERERKKKREKCVCERETKVQPGDVLYIVIYDAYILVLVIHNMIYHIRHYGTSWNTRHKCISCI